MFSSCSRFLARATGALVLALLLACPASAAADKVECGSVRSRILKTAVQYCALLPPSYSANSARLFPVLYSLHGLGDNHQTLINSGGWNLVEQLRSAGKIGDFVIITPNAARTFYVNSRNKRIHYEDFFMREFIPAMEKAFRIGSTRKMRAITGVSMGGYGALRFAFKYPASFSAASAHSAALVESMPQGVGNAPALNQFMGTAFGEPFDNFFWKANTPFVFARTAKLSGLKIYFDCGTEDEYGFDRGAAALDKLLSRRKVAHEFHLYPGGHGWQYAAQHLEQSLIFHWQAFQAR